MTPMAWLALEIRILHTYRPTFSIDSSDYIARSEDDDLVQNTVKATRILNI
jgi:hypothetical protein